ncbi:MAG: tRNA dihydrouridine(20/20a) synthase DusA [Myxococcota bacterium]
MRGRLRALSIAPMMDRTDRHYRFMMRLITKHTLLYTEMIHVNAILRGDRKRFLEFHRSEHPIALQVGGDDPKGLSECAKIAEDWGYDEININVGCPSSRVQSGNFGVCLMLQPERVAEGVAAMRQACTIPVTVKHRIGVDEVDRYEDMARFVRIVAEAEPDRFTVHARKAWLQGLSPKENRNIPPLRYTDVHRLKFEFPEQHIEINGGIKTHEGIQTQLEHVDAVMIGRAAYDNPWLFADADLLYFSESHCSRSRIDVAEQMLDYIERELDRGTRMMSISRHMLQLFAGVPGGRKWRQILGTAAARSRADVATVRQFLKDNRFRFEQPA